MLNLITGIEISDAACTESHAGANEPIREDSMRFLCDDPAAHVDARTDWEALYTFHTPNARKAHLRAAMESADLRAEQAPVGFQWDI